MCGYSMKPEWGVSPAFPGAGNGTGGNIHVAGSGFGFREAFDAIGGEDEIGIERAFFTEVRNSMQQVNLSASVAISIKRLLAKPPGTPRTRR